MATVLSFRWMRGAFPETLADDVDLVVAQLPMASHPTMEHTIGAIRVQGKPLHIPQRVHLPEVAVEPSDWLSTRQRRILACIYSRHADGFVRERQLGALLESDDAWVPPFVVQLIGEYVLPIIQVIDGRREDLARPSYRAFVAENPGFLALTKQRARSYWDCYHRQPFLRASDYPGLRLVQFLEELA